MHIYGQNEDDPDFLLREENFLCKSKFFSSYVTLAYIKKIKNCVKYYDIEGHLVPYVAMDIYQSGIPNIYVVDIEPIVRILWGVEPELVLSFLDLPGGKNNLVKFEDHLFPVSFLVDKSLDDSAGNTMLLYYGFYLYVKVPAGVKEFSLKMYDQHIIPCYSDVTEDVTKGFSYIGELKVNLNDQ